MSTGSILKGLRDAAMMTQSTLAEKVHVTRQAVSRWENDETIPGPDMLVTLSGVFGVSVDALLGLRRSGSANAAVCRWSHPSWEEPETKRQIPDTANGVWRMAASRTQRKSRCWIFWSPICRRKG